MQAAYNPPTYDTPDPYGPAIGVVRYGNDRYEVQVAVGSLGAAQLCVCHSQRMADEIARRWNAKHGVKQ